MPPKASQPSFTVVKAAVKRIPKPKASKSPKRRGAQPLSGLPGDMGSPEAHYRTSVARNPATGRDEVQRTPRVVIEPRERSSSGQVTAMGARVINEAPLERMYGRGELYPGDSYRNEALYQAGLRLRGDFEAAGVRLGGNPSMEPRVDSSARDPEAFIRSKAFQAYSRALDACGPVLGPILRDIICFNEEPPNKVAQKHGLSPRSGTDIFRLALRQLAHLYGIMKLSDGSDQHKAPVKI